jgi:hypothetical protein
MDTSIQGLSRFSDVFGIPHEISYPFLRDVRFWVDNSSEEWTVSRLKSIKLDFIRLKAGLDPVSLFIRRDGSRFFGSIGGLQSWCSCHRKNWSKTIRFLQVYTSFVSSVLTPSQEKKFLDGVNSSPIELPSSLDREIDRALSVLSLGRTYLSSPSPLALYPTSPTRRAPLIDGTSEVEDLSLLSQVSFVTDTHFGYSMMKKYPDIFSSVMKGILYPKSPSEYLVESQKPKSFGTVGRIGLIQEPGYKLRAVANPSRIYQCALQPLGDFLYSILRNLPWDCTFDQLRPTEAIKQRLSLNAKVHSVDLTGATDYFPLDFQLKILDRLVVNREFVSLFKDLSRGQWNYRNSTIRWNKGQPLGLYPSFGSFALAHGLLLFILNDYRHENAFFVLGDDVVILDDHLHSRYRRCLEDFGCPISDSKSVSSNILAEFGGKLFTVDGITHQFKWRVVSDDSFLDFVRNTGPRAISLLRPMQRKIAKALWEVPDFFGGLGFNPSGKSLSDRVYSFLRDYPKSEDLTFVMSYNRILSKMNYVHPRKDPSLHNFVVGKVDFDKKSIDHIIQYLPDFLRWYEVMGANLFSVTGGNTSLRIESHPSWKTLVEKMTKRLGL